MGIGEPIGASFLETINAPPLNSYGNNGVHVSLMGDPTLRAHYVAPASSPGAVSVGGTVALVWTASTDTVDGYHVYRATTKAGPYTKLTNTPVTITGYDDTSAPTGQVWYMVRATKLQATPSGSYHNLSTGVFTDITVAGQAPTIITHPSNQTASDGGTATFTIAASGSGLSYQWQLNGSDISGATSDSYTTPTLTLADNGNNYRCVVSNTSGSVTSNDATLTVTTGGGGNPGGGGGGGGSDGGGGCAIDPSNVPALALWLLLAGAGAFYLRRRRS